MTLVPAHELLAFAAAAFVLIVIPGPSVVFVIGRALAYGRSVALATVAGNSLGLFVVMVLVSLGLGALVAESAAVFTVVKVVGAAYLVWLGVQALRHGRSLHVDDPDAVRATLPWPVAVRQGFVVGVANPKAFMIFAAVLPQFVTPAAGRIPAQMLLLGLLAVLIGRRLRRGLGVAGQSAALLVQRLPRPRPSPHRDRRTLDDRPRAGIGGHRTPGVAIRVHEDWMQPSRGGARLGRVREPDEDRDAEGWRHACTPSHSRPSYRGLISRGWA